jgi:hypothetical protein
MLFLYKLFIWVSLYIPKVTAMWKNIFSASSSLPDFFFRPRERSAAFYCIPTLLPIQQQQKIFPYINIRETPSPYINIRETTSPYINIRETPSPYIYIRETPSPYINIRKLPSPPALMLLRYNFRSFSIQ